MTTAEGTSEDAQVAAGQRSRLYRYRPWLYAAAAYNLAWGTAIILFPALIFDALSLERPNYLPIWQVVGMFVLVYAPAYWWAGRHPDRFPQLVLIGMLGKVLGPIGFLWSVATADFPLLFGVTILTNDLIWWPAFVLYLRDAAVLRGGWLFLVRGD